CAGPGAPPRPPPARPPRGGRLRPPPAPPRPGPPPIDDGNAAVSKAESVRKFRILSSQFTEESGHLTPSLKLKRNVVAKDYADEIEAIYQK
ncbi:hypothetical protein, partial [Streptomyces bottropensis]|uniref:hypothetical protein n=1 Tax=Streptomyces bottropensis TaxID=42235 RepID=UPI0036C45DBA